MNKRLVALVSCAIMLLSSVAVSANSARNLVAVDVVAAATTSAPAPTTPGAPSKPSTGNTWVVPTTSADITRFLALGSVGGDVKLLQTLLSNNGYVLKVDGIFGEKTLAAVNDYQAKNGLRVDGVVGPRTLAKLAPAVAEEVKEETPVVEENVAPDALTTASLVNRAAGFEKAISKDGTWIIATLNNLVINKELVLEGEIKNGKQNPDGTDQYQRKIALYTQDDKRNVLEEFSLTAPKLTVKSTNARIQNGTFKGDIYVEAKDFQLVGTKVEGNVYFTTQEAKDTFKMDAKSSISGEKVLVDVDATSTASIVRDAAAFEKAISKEGSWIAATLRDLTFDKELVLEGEFVNGKKDANGNDVIQRKIAPYTQITLEDGKKVPTRRFTITAPKLTIKSPNARIQAGIFKGDVYVAVPNFQLVDARVEGNIYFLNNEVKETFKMDEKSSLTGKKVLIVEDADALSTASIVSTEAAFEKAMVTEENGGKWIGALLKDMFFTKPITMEGRFENRGAEDRKIGLYSQVTLEDKTKVKTHNFTLTAPKLFIKSPTARMLSGTFNGNLYVYEDNFKLEDMTVNGNLYFTTESAKATFNNVNSKVTGKQELVNPDVITSASVVTDAETLEKSVSEHGVWIICLEDDITTDKELVLEGDFRGTKTAPTGPNAGTLAFDRKLALYTQDDKRNITGEFTLKTPQLTVNSPKARIENGTIEGDLYIVANGVTLKNTKVIGNVYFATQEAKDTFNPTGTYSISGEQKVK